MSVYTLKKNEQEDLKKLYQIVREQSNSMNRNLIYLIANLTYKNMIKL